MDCTFLANEKNFLHTYLYGRMCMFFSKRFWIGYGRKIPSPNYYVIVEQISDAKVHFYIELKYLCSSQSLVTLEMKKAFDFQYIA